jgi:hypothetical protein
LDKVIMKVEDSVLTGADWRLGVKDIPALEKKNDAEDLGALDEKK